jgi:hypothetical protein
VATYVLTNQASPSLQTFMAQRLFGNTRYQVDAYKRSMNEKMSVYNLLRSVLSALETSGFYDDPRDRRRTMTNLEEACIAYIDRWNWTRMPVWIRDGQ